MVGQAGIDFILSIQTTDEVEELHARWRAFAIRATKHQELLEAPQLTCAVFSALTSVLTSCCQIKSALLCNEAVDYFKGT